MEQLTWHWICFDFCVRFIPYFEQNINETILDLTFPYWSKISTELQFLLLDFFHINEYISVIKTFLLFVVLYIGLVFLKKKILHAIQTLNEVVIYLGLGHLLTGSLYQQSCCNAS